MGAVLGEGKENPCDREATKRGRSGEVVNHFYDMDETEDYCVSLQAPEDVQLQQKTREREGEATSQSPGNGNAMDAMIAKWNSRSRSARGEVDSVARCTGMRYSTTIRTLTGGDGADALTLCSKWSKVATRPGCMLDSCSAVNLIHVDHVLNLQRPRIEKTNLSIRESTGTAPAHGEVRQGEIHVVLRWGTADAVIIRPHFYTTTNPGMMDHPLLGMPFLQELGASLHLLPHGYQFHNVAAQSPGYGALEYCAAMGTRDAPVKIFLPHHSPPHGTLTPIGEMDLNTSARIEAGEAKPTAIHEARKQSTRPGCR